MRKTSYFVLLSLIVINLTSCQKSDDSKPDSANPPTNEAVNELATPQCRSIEKSKNSKTSLHYAILKKDFAALVSLINTHKIDINSMDENGFTAFDYAITLELEDHAQVLLENGANVNGLEAQESFPLQLAVLRRSEKMIKFLIEKKAYLNQRDSKGITALMSTTSISDQREFNSIFSTLLNAGAKAYLVDCNGNNIIFEKISLVDDRSKSKVLNQYITLNRKDLLEIKDKPGILVMTALDLNSEDQLALNLIKIGAKANAPGILVKLCSYERYGYKYNSTIEKFIAAGADVNSKLNTSDISPLECNINYQGVNSSAVSILLSNGARGNAKSNNIKLNGSVDVASVQKLKELGFNVSLLKDSGGDNPLIISASKYQNIQLMNYLLDNGADPKAVNYNGKNSLVFLFSDPNEKNITFDEIKNLVSKMIKLGLSISKDSNLFHVITTDGYIDLLRLVAENGADLTFVDSTYAENPLLHNLFQDNYKQNNKLKNWSTNQSASINEIKELLTFFASKGYDFNKKNKYNESLEYFIENLYKKDSEAKNSIIQHLKSLSPSKP